MLRFVGCTADAHEAAASSGGDEIAFNAGISRVFMGSMPEMLGYMVRHVAEETPPLQRGRASSSVP